MYMYENIATVRNCPELTFCLDITLMGIKSPNSVLLSFQILLCFVHILKPCPLNLSLSFVQVYSCMLSGCNYIENFGVAGGVPKSGD